MTVLTAESFDSAVSGSSGTWLVDFWAEWCATCRGYEPVLAEVAAETDEVRVAKLDVSAYPDIGDRFGIKSLPTTLIFRDGVEVRRLFGAKTKRQLLVAVADGP